MQDNLTYLYAPLTKRDAATRMVEGAISGNDNLDLDKQIVDASFLRRVVGPWFKFGNIREQHIPTKAVGKAKTVDVTADGVPFITAKIVDDAAWAKVEEGVYSGFSVGIKNARIVRDPDAPNGRIVDGDLVEVSIVDHPANPEAKFAICKAASSGGWVDLQNGVVIEPNMLPNQNLTLPKVQVDDEPKKMTDTDTTPTSAAASASDSAVTTPLATDDEYKSVEAGLTKGFAHTHHYLDDSATPVHGRHTHDKGGYSDGYEMSAPYAEHKHCRTCGNDDRMCGHGKKSMKDATPDAPKVADDFMGGEPKPDTPSPAPSSVTMRRSIEAFMQDVKGKLESLSLDLPFEETPATHDAAFAHTEATPAQSWTGGDLFRIKEVVADVLKEILPTMVQTELAKSFGNADMVTKGATPDAVKAAVISLAEEAAKSAIEPVEKRLSAVEDVVPVHGVANTQDVEKRFAGNRDNQPKSMEEIIKIAQGLPEADRMKAAQAAIAEAQRHPMNLWS